MLEGKLGQDYPGKDIRSFSESMDHGGDRHPQGASKKGQAGFSVRYGKPSAKSALEVNLNAIFAGRRRIPREDETSTGPFRDT